MGGNPQKLMTNLQDRYIHNKIYQHMIHLLDRQQVLGARKIILLCIGSDRYIGDALGPLVGSYLAEHTLYPIYGTLDHPVHGGNLVKVIHEIYEQEDQPIVIAIDACLGKLSEIGNIEIWEGSLEAGSAVGACLPCVGDISIIGVVNESSLMGCLALQSTPLSLVMKLSQAIAKALREVIHDIS